MQITLLLEQAQAAGMPMLARWLARGDRIDAVKPGREAQLRTHFEFHGPALPIAALTRSVDANDADSAQWLRCDPAYVMADAVTLRLVACGDLQLSEEEVAEFARVLKPLFGDAGFPLEAVRSDRWYLRCPREAKLPKFSDPADALGDDFARHLPEGDNARQWRSLLNEAQIVLTQHPLNAQRIQRGLPPVNSVWFWGAGVLPQWVRSRFGRVVSDDEITTILARLAKVPEVGAANAFSSPLAQPGERAGEGALFALLTAQKQNPPSPNPLPRTEKMSGGEGVESPAATLIDLASARHAEALERNWFAPIDAQLAKRKLVEVHLHFLSGERVTIKPAHRWRFWRRVKP